eukprot:scaffold128501_cov32-Tisochrysis_lutea.AAC.5
MASASEWLSPAETEASGTCCSAATRRSGETRVGAPTPGATTPEWVWPSRPGVPPMALGWRGRSVPAVCSVPAPSMSSE